MVRNGTNQAQVVDERTPLTSSRDLVHGQGTIKIPHDDAQEVQSSENVSVARSILPTLLFGESLLSWPITSPVLTIMQEYSLPRQTLPLFSRQAKRLPPNSRFYQMPPG